jgi:hypothetical protein
VIAATILVSAVIG